MLISQKRAQWPLYFFFYFHSSMKDHKRFHNPLKSLLFLNRAMNILDTNLMWMFDSPEFNMNSVAHFIRSILVKIMWNKFAFVDWWIDCSITSYGRYFRIKTSINETEPALYKSKTLGNYFLFSSLQKQQPIGRHVNPHKLFWLWPVITPFPTNIDEVSHLNHMSHKTVKSKIW